MHNEEFKKWILEERKKNDMDEWIERSELYRKKYY